MSKVADEYVEEARAEAHELLDSMFDHMKDAHRGNRTAEIHRDQSMQFAVSCFWRIYEAGLTWAEDFVRGRYLIEKYPEITKILEPVRYLFGEDDTWLFEEVGRIYEVRNSTGYHDPHQELDAVLGQVFDFLDKHIDDVDWEENQHVIADMTRSNLADGSWRALVHSHIVDLLIGRKSPLLSPQKRKHGSARELFWAKLSILREVAYRQGYGDSKTRARQFVGQAIGVSEYTIKKWEFELKSVDDVDFQMYCAGIAGAAEAHLAGLDNPPSLEQFLKDDEDFDSVWFGVTKRQEIIEQASLRENNSLENLRIALREARSTIKTDK